MRIYGYYCPKCRGTEVQWSLHRTSLVCVEDKTSVEFFLPLHQYSAPTKEPPRIRLSRSWNRKYRFLYWLMKKGHILLGIWTSKFHIKVLIYCRSDRHDKFPIEMKTRLRELMETHWPRTLKMIEDIEKKQLMEGYDGNRK